MTLKTHKSLSINSYREKREREKINWKIGRYFLFIVPLQLLFDSHARSLNHYRSYRFAFSFREAVRLPAVWKPLRESSGFWKSSPLNKILRYMYWLSARIIVFVRFILFTDFDLAFVTSSFFFFFKHSTSLADSAAAGVLAFFNYHKICRGILTERVEREDWKIYCFLRKHDKKTFVR